jgi:hypothetical protein
MSTYFRPRLQPPSTPTSPVRPSTAHSTIRAITPSPPDSSRTNFPLPRPKSEHALGSPELATFKKYVFKAEAGGFSNTPVDAAKVQCGGIASGRSSPIKDERVNPAKSGRTSPVKARSKSPRKQVLSMLQGFAESPARDDEPMVDSPVQPAVQEHHAELEDEHQHWPETPTPMSREQKRQAYTPLSIPAYSTPSQLQRFPPPNLREPNSPLNLASPAKDRVSVSTSSASKHSIGIFSTPGRDEMERKKALVEVDEGPFARAKSMVDLREERRRVSKREEEEDGKVSGEDKKEKERVFRCGLGCVVM